MRPRCHSFAQPHRPHSATQPTAGRALYRLMQRSGAAAAAAAAAAAPPPAADTLTLWLVRRDLRLADNPALLAAATPRARWLLPLLCLDPIDLCPRRSVEQGGAGVPLLGPHHCRLLLEAAHSLRSDLQARGSGLAFALAPPAAALPAALAALAPALAPARVRRVALVLTHAPAGDARGMAAEKAAAAAFVQAARALGLEPAVIGCCGATLYHPDELPYAAFSGSKQAQRQAQQRQEGLQQQAAAAATAAAAGGSPDEPQQQAAWWEEAPSPTSWACSC